MWLEDVFANYDFDMSIVAHVEPLDLAQYGNAEYYWGNDSPAAKALLDQADAEPDADARNALYGQVLDEITAQAADQWLFVIPALAVKTQRSDRLRGEPARFARRHPARHQLSIR